jgi:hypothetical protein
MNTNKLDSQYEVFSPWADVDAMPLKGIVPRVTDLAGKKIGFFASAKGMAKPVVTVVERKLREKFPACETSFYEDNETFIVPQVEGKNKAKFEKWVSGLDAAVAAIGD